MLIFAVPALFASGIVSIALFGIFSGALWLFVLGDNPWPEAVGTGLVSMLVLVLLSSWVGLLALAYRAGQRQESYPSLNRVHLALSAAATLLLLLLVVIHQFSVGNLGIPTDSVLCSNACREKGFTSSGVPPKDTGKLTCRCFDAQGNEALKFSVERLRAKTN